MNFHRIFYELAYITSHVKYHFIIIPDNVNYLLMT